MIPPQLAALINQQAGVGQAEPAAGPPGPQQGEPDLIRHLQDLLQRLNAAQAPHSEQDHQDIMKAALILQGVLVRDEKDHEQAMGATGAHRAISKASASAAGI